MNGLFATCGRTRNYACGGDPATSRVHGLASTGSVDTDPLVGVTPQSPSKRTVILKVRLTEEEATQLKEQSARTGRTMSDAMRSAWKKLKIIELPPADFAETVTELRRIGNNLNQVARAVNMGEVHIPEIQTVLKEIVAIDKKLNRILSGGGV